MELTYLVRGADGKQYGPASFEELSSWIRDGRVPAHQEVQRSDMQHWAAAGAFTEFQPLFGAQQSPAAAAPTAVAAAPATSAKADPATIAQLRSGGSWFYWVAGLSLVNTIAALSGSDWRFIVGLGITQMFDGFASQMASGGKIVALVLDLLAAGVFVGFGVFANKGHTWAFIVGMVLFALDGLIFLLVKDWIGVAFHAFVVYCLWRGLTACRELRRA